MKRQINQCLECDSEYYADSSKMLGLCPECSHHIYGYKNCEHVFEKGRCVKCCWDGSSTAFIEELKNSTNQSSKVMKEFEIEGNDFGDLNSFFDAIGTQLVEKNEWGKNWNALNDILYGGFIKTEYEEPFKLIWNNSEVSKSRLKDFHDIVDLIKKHKHIELILK
jgi:RNAse (barnase) inhibitor barstar